MVLPKWCKQGWQVAGSVMGIGHQKAAPSAVSRVRQRACIARWACQPAAADLAATRERRFCCSLNPAVGGFFFGGAIRHAHRCRQTTAIRWRPCCVVPNRSERALAAAATAGRNKTKPPTHRCRRVGGSSGLLNGMLGWCLSSVALRVGGFQTALSRRRAQGRGSFRCCHRLGRAMGRNPVCVPARTRKKLSQSSNVRAHFTQVHRPGWDWTPGRGRPGAWL